MSATTPHPPGQELAADPVTEVGRAFKGAVAAHRRLRGRERRHPGGLRDAQYSLLFGLGDSEALSLRELADRADLSPAAATELLDELVEHGLAMRTRSEADRRVVLISLTERGTALVAERRAEFEPRWRAAFAGLSGDELGNAVAVLVRMRELFEDLAED